MSDLLHKQFTFLTDLKSNLINAFFKTEHDGVVYSIVAFANEQKTHARLEYQYELIQLLVERGFFTARLVDHQNLLTLQF